jgi:hypothetical protein
MSDLRIQLDAARTAYSQIRYPGNLAAEVMFKRRHRTLLRVAAITAAAAALALAVILPSLLNHRPTESEGGTLVAMTSPSSQAQNEMVEAEPISYSMPGLPLLPDGFSIVPSSGMPSAFPGLPGLFTVTDHESDQGESKPTTRESL